jgi:hypothetical protein
MPFFLFKSTPAPNPTDRLDIVVSRRLKKTWRVKADFRTGARVLSIPPVLADAPDDIKECLTRWALMPMGRRTRGARNTEYVKNKKSLERTIRAYMESRGVSNTRISRIDPAVFKHQTKGLVFDLQVIFDTLNRVYFQNKIESYIRWGRAASKTSYQDTRLDKNGNRFNLITVSGVYDSPRVPEYVIYGLIYHEMLHIAIPPRRVNGRRVIHGRDFKAAMKKYPFEEKWVKWEKENMRKLITNAKNKQKAFLKFL